jgi:ribonuclease D
VLHHFICDQSSLISLCEQLAKADVLAIDTEFVRTRTLYPILGLLQVSDGENIALIDPIAIDDLSPFWHLLENASICKVLHACSEDLEVFLHAGQCKPKNLIDSQILMAFLGHGISLGYAAMVKHYLDIDLDKSESRTDWTQRPLSEKQCQYAKADVEHLFVIFPKLIAEVQAKGWLAAAKEESQLMINKKFTPINAELLYQNVKLSWKLSPVQLNRLKYLAIWRFEQAQKRDLPLGFIAKDHTLFGLAEKNPTSVGGMMNIEGLEINDIRHKGKAMLQVLRSAEQVDEASYPNSIVRLDQYPGYKQTFKQLKTFLISLAKQANIGMENLASKKQINHYLSWYYQINDAEKLPEKVELLTGWRQQILAGKLQSFADNGFS